MKMRYLMNGATLSLESTLCNGCWECIEVCPHAVFAMADGKAAIADRESCMECGACMINCAAGAIRVRAGVGCAAAVLKGMLQGTEPTCGCGGSTVNASSKAGAGGSKRGCC
jgi:NAD-dependent dihydropyrimidine dehydrogenase PreA subunit